MKIYILFQTDVWQTVDSRVCFGAFGSYEKAVSNAKENGLYTHDAEVVIIETSLDVFEEI